jgi:spermidine/putrescine-binding protein
MMKTFTIALLAGVGALSAATGAKAADVYTTSEYMNPDLIQEVRMVCDEDGNCYRSRSRSRVIVRDSYATMPSDRYYERRTYHRHYDDGPRAGVGIRAPGVSVGVGVNDRW